MKYITIEAIDFGSVKDYHAYLGALFGFPEYYGENLDALRDCLTDIGDDVTVAIPEGFGTAFDGYGDRILKVFEDAASRNGRLSIIMT